MWQRLITFALVSTLLFVAVKFSVKAQSVTFTAQVGDTSLVVNGFSSPNSLVVFKQNNAVIGTTTSLPTGEFTKQFSALTGGLFILDIYAIDTNNVTSAAIQRNLYLIEFQEFEINDIYTPPTLKLTQEQSNILIQGYTLPNTPVKIIVNTSPVTSINLLSNVSGFFEDTIPIDSLGIGNFSINASIVDNINQQVFANPVSFELVPNQEDETNNSTLFVPINENTQVKDTTEVSKVRSYPILNWQALGEVLGERGVDYFNEEKIIPPIVISTLLLVLIIVIIVFGIYRIFSVFYKNGDDK